MSYEDQRRHAYVRDGGRCLVCGRPGQSVHHRQGRRGADPHRLSNLITVCGDGARGCHGERIHGSPRTAYENGWMVRRLGILTTENTPVLTFRGWILLDDHGGITISKGPE